MPAMDVRIYDSEDRLNRDAADIVSCVCIRALPVALVPA